MSIFNFNSVFFAFKYFESKVFRRIIEWLKEIESRTNKKIGKKQEERFGKIPVQSEKKLRKNLAKDHRPQ